jgi:uncharacterized protein YjcR
MKEQAIRSIAKGLGIKPAAITKWRQRGVPHRWRWEIQDEAARQGVVLSREDFDKFKTGGDQGDQSLSRARA